MACYSFYEISADLPEIFIIIGPNHWGIGSNVSTMIDSKWQTPLGEVEVDSKIAEVDVLHGPNRAGDIPHSLASIEKAKNNLGYHPKYSIEQGIKEAVSWYYNNLKLLI